MKFLLAVALLMVVSQSVIAQNADSKLRTKCTYFADSLILNCTGPSGRVECEASNLFPLRVKIVGIALPKETTSTLAKFDLHPLREDNTAWLSNRMMLNGTMTSFSIYQSNLIKDAGFRLRDAQCFERLASLFRSSTSNLNVPMSEELRGGKPSRRADLLGEIFVFERSLARPKTGAARNVRQNPVVMEKQNTRMINPMMVASQQDTRMINPMMVASQQNARQLSTPNPAVRKL